MKIWHIASEISPLAKVGGLADVVYGLAIASQKAGHDVSVVIPAYPHLKTEFFTKIEKKQIKAGPNLTYNLYRKKFKKITLYGIDLVHPHFSRPTIYGGEDEVAFFATFSKAAAHLVVSHKIDLLHGHDWQSAFSLFELKHLKSPIKSILTLHNLQYQGKMSLDLAHKLGLSSPLSPWMLDPNDQTLVNLLRMGIESADRVTTVSRTYHDQLLEGAMAFGLEKTLLDHRHKFIGILNGIDTHYFNPFTDPLLKHPYPKTVLKNPKLLHQAKLENLKLLLQEHEKPDDPRFTVCSITRLAEQKAPNLILYALKKTIEMGGRFILVGSLHGSPHDKKIIETLHDFKEHPHVLIELNTDSEMAHQTYASSDALIVPSYFEPCGLTQLIALRYGTVPLVRATGGLKDTVFDVATGPVEEQKRNGFTFDFADEGGVDWVLERAFALYKNHLQKFQELAYHGLLENHSWEIAAVPYLDLYQILMLDRM